MCPGCGLQLSRQARVHLEEIVGVGEGGGNGSQQGVICWRPEMQGAALPNPAVGCLFRRQLVERVHILEGIGVAAQDGHEPTVDDAEGHSQMVSSIWRGAPPECEVGVWQGLVFDAPVGGFWEAMHVDGQRDILQV